jgi:hypothetical protein
MAMTPTKPKTTKITKTATAGTTPEERVSAHLLSLEDVDGTFLREQLVQDVPHARVVCALQKAEPLLQKTGNATFCTTKAARIDERHWR